VGEVSEFPELFQLQRYHWQMVKGQVDLFALENTTHCPLWFAQMEASSPLGQDALSHDWPDCLLYAFVGDTSQDCSGQTQGTSESTMVALQTMVSLAPNLAASFWYMFFDLASTAIIH